MSSAPGSPGSRAAVRLAERGPARRRLRGGAAGRRALPLLPRPDARPDDRQRQPPAALRQSRPRSTISTRSARADALDGPAQAEFAVRRPRDRRALDAAPERRPPAVVDFRRAPARAGQPGAAIISRRSAMFAQPASGDGRRGDGLRGPALRAALAARARSRRSTPTRMRPPRRLPRRSCARRSAPAGAPAGRLSPRDGLSAALRRSGAALSRTRKAFRIRFGDRLRAIRFEGDARPRLDFGDRAAHQLDPGDASSSRCPAWSRDGPASRPCRADRIPRDRQRAFPDHAAAGQPASARHRQRPERMAVRLSGSSVRHDQRRRPAASTRRARSSRRRSGARSRRLTGLAGGPAALADRQGEARDLRGDARRRRRKRPGRADALAQPCPGRRLDRDRPAGHDRRRGPFGLYGGGSGLAGGYRGGARAAAAA